MNVGIKCQEQRIIPERISCFVQAFIKSFTNVSIHLQHNSLLSLTLSSLTLFVFRCWIIEWGPGVGLSEAMWKRSSLLWCVASRWHYSFASWHWVCIITRVSNKKNYCYAYILTGILSSIQMLMSYLHVCRSEIWLLQKVKRKTAVFKDPVPLKDTSSAISNLIYLWKNNITVKLKATLKWGWVITVYQHRPHQPLSHHLGKNTEYRLANNHWLFCQSYSVNCCSYSCFNL